MRYKERAMPSTVVGTYTRTGNATKSYAKTSKLELIKSESIADSTSAFPHTEPNPLFIKKRQEGCVRASGSVTTRLGGVQISERWGSYPVARLSANFGVDSLTPLSSYAALALERATPNKPAFSLGEVIQSVYEIPRMINSIRSILKGYTNSASIYGEIHLGAEFGLKPIISDIQSIMKLQRSLAISARNQRRAEKGKSFRGTLYKRESKSSSRHWMPSFWHLHSYDVEHTYNTKVWYSVRFRTGNTVPTPKALAELSNDLSEGSRTLKTLWNAIPWSFLVDYFVNFGAYLSNFQAMEVKDICIMRTMEARSKVRSDSETKANGLWNLRSKDLRFTSKDAHVVYKQRSVFTSGAFVPFSFFLNASQLTNILALGASRRYL